MKINNTGYIGFQGINEAKKEFEAEDNSHKTKEFDASANNALASYGQAFVNIAFRGGSQDKQQTIFEIRDLTDKEYKEYRVLLDKKIKTLPDDASEYIYDECEINRTNIFLIDRILSEKSLCDSDFLFWGLPNLLESADDLEKTKAKVHAIDKMKKEKLANDKNLMPYIPFMIFYSKSIEDAEAKIDIMKYLNEEDILKEDNVRYYIDDIIQHTRTAKEAKTREKFIETLKSKNLLSNKSIQECLGCLIYSTNQKESAYAKIDVIEELEKNGLIDNKSVKKNLGYIISEVDKKEDAKIKTDIIKELGKPDIYENRSIKKYAGKIIDFVYSKKDLELTQKLISNKHILQNEAVISFIYGDSINTNKYIKYVIKQSDNNISKLNSILENSGVQKLSKTTTIDIRDLNKLMRLSKFDLQLVKAIINNPNINAEIQAKGTDKLYETLDSLYEHMNFDEFKQYVDDSFDISLGILQNDSGMELIATKKIDSIDNPKDTPDSKKTKVKMSIINTNGVITKSKSEISGDVSITRYKNGDNVAILNKINEDRDISSQFEIVKDENNEPSFIIYTKESDLLKGIYETAKYRLKDYPEDIDIIEGIKNGTLSNKDIISSVKKLDDGLVVFDENYEYEDTTTKRKYSIKQDGSYEYSYHINDNSNNPILSLDRSFNKNSNNRTTTIVNGREYKAFFNNKKMQITITDDKGEKTNIDIKSKLVDFDDYDKEEKEYIKDYFGSEEKMQKDFFNFLKNVPADQLLSLNKYVSKITVTKLSDSGIDQDKERNLSIGLHMPTFAHEMGHGFDFRNCNYSSLGKISGNKDVIKIYNEEMDIFRKKYADDYQDIIKYFNQTGGGNYNNTGLSEFVAETNMLLTTYGDDNDRTKTRSQYLVRYFPRTIAKIAELLGYNK